MRALLVALTLGVAGAAFMPMHPAQAWWDRFHRWHPYYYGPRIVVAPPPVYYARPYARWVPPHYNPWGRFIPGHWA